jgi:hypothetical protein
MSFNLQGLRDPNLDKYTLEREDLFKQTSRSYTDEEMKVVFQLFNSYNPAAKKTDTGCGSCRRQVLNFMHTKWHQLKKESEPNV